MNIGVGGVSSVDVPFHTKTREKIPEEKRKNIKIKKLIRQRCRFDTLYCKV